LLLVSARASAQERPLAEAVAVARAGECFVAAALVEHMETWLRRSTVHARISVVVEDEDPGASFVVLRDGVPSAARRFDTLPAACSDRRAALALAIALAIDAAVLDDLVPASRPEPDAPIPDPPSPGPAAERTAIRVEVAVEGQVIFEVLPEVAAGWQIGPRVIFDETFELGLSAWLTSVSGAELQPGRVDSQLAGARLDACLRRPGVLMLRGCVGVAGGVGRGMGHDVPGARETLVGFVGLLGRLGLGIELTEALALEISGDAWVALVRPRFDLVDAGEAVRSVTLPLAGGTGAAGLAFRF